MHLVANNRNAAHKPRRHEVTKANLQFRRYSQVFGRFGVGPRKAVSAQLPSLVRPNKAVQNSATISFPMVPLAVTLTASRRSIESYLSGGGTIIPPRSG